MMAMRMTAVLVLMAMTMTAVLTRVPQDLPMTSALGQVMPSSAAITPEPHLGTMQVRKIRNRLDVDK